MSDLIKQVLERAIAEASPNGELFPANQAPTIIQQLMMYKTIEYLVYLVIAIGVFTLGVFLVKQARRISNWASESDPLKSARLQRQHNEGLSNMFYVFSGAVLLCSSLWGVFVTILFTKLLVAPNVWLVEYAARL